MYCIHCGTELIDGTCPKCQEEKTSEQPKAELICEKKNPKQEPMSAMIFGIVSFATSILGLIGYGYPLACIAAIVFSVLYEGKMGKCNKLAKAGKILGIVGLIVKSIALLVYFAICYVIAFVCMTFAFFGMFAI